MRIAEMNPHVSTPERSLLVWASKYGTGKEVFASMSLTKMVFQLVIAEEELVAIDSVTSDSWELRVRAHVSFKFILASERLVSGPAMSSRTAVVRAMKHTERISG